ncbi:transferase [Bacillus thuringiensis]|uniref:acyltransferase n=1 Tax=Bacillus thuringiensis TaxID=1428 RepID=UPI000BEE1305|nr:acyltransferase [Bacillus thuringiensis]MEB9403804.1 acyltransferase [Bacillus cereus]MCC6081344.1 acyltransferase [Bacillus thuringiensis]MEB9554720.1 acyltransferase [Bacillus cereus]PEB88264.1 transferase [Bacillus thuringiensis]PFJ61692.1 transferase [Bacillus thuringiensis]
MISFLNIVITKLKGKEYKLDANISATNLVSIICTRLISFLRGICKRIGLKACGKVLFIGKRVQIKNRNMVELGNSVTLEDGVQLDGLSKEGLKLGNNVKIGSFTIISCTGSLKNLGKGLSIGDNSGVGDFSFFGAAGGIKIGSNVIMGQNVRFHSENHNFDRIDIPIKEQGVTNKGITIGEDCWIGSGAVFLDGVEVGKGCVIGANTLVNKNIPAYSVAVGNPVKIVKSRLEKKGMLN